MLSVLWSDAKGAGSAKWTSLLVRSVSLLLCCVWIQALFAQGMTDSEIGALRFVSVEVVNV